MLDNALPADVLAPAMAAAAAAPRSPAGIAARVSPALLGGLARCLEMASMAGAGLALVAFATETGGVAEAIAATLTLAASGVASALFDALGLYGVRALRHPAHHLPRLVACWTVIATAAVGLGATVSADPARLAVAMLIGGVALVAARLVMATVTRTLTRQGRLTRRAVIYGSGAPCRDLIKALAADPDSDIRVCGIYDDRGGERGAADAKVPNAAAVHQGSLANLIGFAQSANVDLVMLALPISAETRLIELLRKLWVLPADVRLAASASRLKLASSAYATVGDVELIALADKPISDWGLLVKSIFDRVIGALALIALSPVMIAAAIAIKLDSRGPVFFKQKRYGFNNELIEVYKFRSMYTDLADQAAARLVTKDDPRVTRVGRFIRKTSIDELPQLVNVLIGNLSLVGPRPHAVSAKAAGKLYGDAVDSYFARHKVKPGITGWAQINGWRGETDTEDKLRHRIEHDLYYIEHWSVAFDAQILLRTPRSLLKSDNAY